MALTPYYSKAEADQKNKETFRDVENTVQSISAGEGGKSYATLAEAQAVSPVPINGTVFQVEEAANSGYHIYDSASTGGTRFLRSFVNQKTNQLVYDFNSSGFEIGAISNTGDFIDSNFRIRSKNLIPIIKGDFTISLSNALIQPQLVIEYNGADYFDFINLGVEDFSITSELVSSIRLTLKKVDDSSFSQSEIDDLKVEIYEKSNIGYNIIQEKINTLNNKMEYNFSKSPLEFGAFSSTDGGITFDNNLRVRSKFFNPLKSGVYEIRLESNFGLKFQLCHGYLDEVFVKRLAFEEKVFKVDNTVNQFRLTAKKPDDSVITQEELDDLKIMVTSKDKVAYDFIQEDIKKILYPTASESTIISSKWKGKKITALGDSITYGFIPRNSTGYPGQLDSYAKLLAQDLESVFVNKGINGSTIGALGIGDTTNNPFVYRYNDIGDDTDLVTVLGGINDLRKGIPLGSFSDSDETTFYGALHVLCLGLLQKFKIDLGYSVGAEKKILFLTCIKNGTTLETVFNGHTLSEFNQAIKEVCAYYSIPVWNAYDLSGINPHILRTVQGTETGYTDMYNPYITDGTHPTQEGHVMFKNNLVGFINSI